MKRHIILAEDDEPLSYSWQRMLEHAGYEVAAYTSSISCWDAVGPGTHPDLLIADVRLAPGEPHGIALARHARHSHPSLPIIIVTGYPDTTAAEGDAGVHIFHKPVAPEVLLDKVKKLLPLTG